MSKTLYEAISDLAVNDPTVYAHLKMQQKLDSSDDMQVAVSLIRALVHEKAGYMKLATHVLETSSTANLKMVEL